MTRKTSLASVTLQSLSAKRPTCKPHTCICRCGAYLSRFDVPGINPHRPAPTSAQQTRLYARPIPKSRLRQVNGADVEQRKQATRDRVVALAKDADFRSFVSSHLRSPPDQAVSFLSGLLSLRESLTGSVFPDRGEFMMLQVSHLNARERSVLDDEVGTLAYYLCFQASRNAARKKLERPVLLEHVGRYLMETLASQEHVEAVLTVCNLALLMEQRSRREVFSLPSIRPAYVALKRLAGEKDADHRVLTMAARCAVQEGREDAAVALLERALKPAQRASVDETLRDANTPKKIVWYNDNGRMQSLDTPWVDVAELYRRRVIRLRGKGQQQKIRVELDNLLRSTEFGCQLDDMLSHYQRAEYLTLDDTSTGRDPSWVYHMTKAASSQHFHAAFRLGEYYLRLASTRSKEEWESMASATKRSVEFSSSDTFDDAQVSTEQNAERQALRSMSLFPQTPEQAWLLGTRWLEVSAKYRYAPAYLSLAEAYLPDPAVIDPPPSSQTSDSSPPLQTKSHRDEHKAQSRMAFLYQALAAEFYVDSAAQTQSKFRDNSTNTASSPPSSSVHPPPSPATSASKYQEASMTKMGLIMTAQTLVARAVYPAWIGEWLRFPEIFTHWSAEAARLELRARELCDRMDWTMRSPDGSIFYQAQNTGMKTVLKGAGSSIIF